MQLKPIGSLLNFYEVKIFQNSTEFIGSFNIKETTNIAIIGNIEDDEIYLNNFLKCKNAKAKDSSITKHPSCGIILGYDFSLFEAKVKTLSDNKIIACSLADHNRGFLVVNQEIRVDIIRHEK